MEQFEAMLRKEMWQDEAMESTTKASRQALGLSDLDAVSKARLGLVGMCAVSLCSDMMPLCFVYKKTTRTVDITMSHVCSHIYINKILIHTPIKTIFSINPTPTSPTT